MAALVGFCGSRSLPPRFVGAVASVVAAVLAAGRGVAVGCAGGADAFVRSACPSARVFSVASGAWGSGRGALAARSVACVRAVAASGPGAGWVGFVVSACPAGLAPSSSPSACFAGFGSGSWASCAFAAALGLPVAVFWCGPGPAVLPASWGSWSSVASGPFAGGWLLLPSSPAARLPGF